MTESKDADYDFNMVAVCEAVWGEGYISPGGPEEVERIVGDVVLPSKEILDIGCGSGGIDRFLAKRYHPSKITGVDVEPSLITHCIEQARLEGLSDLLSYGCIEPGPLPFESESFDVVFTKDSLIHIEDKHAICSEVFRVLRSGGTFIASDWMSGDGPVSPELQRYIDLEDIGFGMAGQTKYRDALVSAGFSGIRFIDRNDWYRELARDELSRLRGELFEPLSEKVGRDYTEHTIETWSAMCVVLDRGELRPTHWHATKP